MTPTAVSCPQCGESVDVKVEVESLLLYPKGQGIKVTFRPQFLSEHQCPGL